MEHTADTPASNLTTTVRNQQIRFGVMLFAATLVGAVLLREAGIDSLLRYVLFVPVLFAFYGLAMGLTGICSLSAAAAVRRTEEGPEPIVDRGELRAIRRRGMYIMISTLASALAVTISLVR